MRQNESEELIVVDIIPYTCETREVGLAVEGTNSFTKCVRLSMRIRR
jgi:hypothetical protein